MKEKEILITGANPGIGKEAAKELAKSGDKIYLASRSVNSTKETGDEIVKESKNENVFVRELDLASPESIRKFVESFKKDESKRDVLINNAVYGAVIKW